MNIFLYELKAIRKSTLIWIISLVALLVLFMSLFPSFSKDMESVNELLGGFPEPVRNALGIELDTFGSLLGYYSYAFTYLTLCGAIQAMYLGTNILSKETREKTADFLFTKPVTRVQILFSKIMAGVVSLLITNLVYLGVGSATLAIVNTKSFDTGVFLLMSLTLLFIQLIFLAIGLIVSMLMPKIKSVISVSLGTVFAFYLIGMLASTGEDEAKRYFSPFKYFDSRYIVEHSKYEIPFLVAGVTIILISVTATFYIYRKKDIHTV